MDESGVLLSRPDQYEGHPADEAIRLLRFGDGHLRGAQRSGPIRTIQLLRSYTYGHFG